MISEDSMMISKDEAPRFLFINPFGIGDVLFTTPVLRSVKNAYPASFIGYWCNERVGDILKSHPYIDSIFPLSRGDLKKISKESKFKSFAAFWGLVANLRKGKFDISLDFSLDHRYSLMTKLAGVPRRIGFDYKGRGRFLTDKTTLQGYQTRHVVEHYLDLLKPLKIEPSSRNLELFVSEGEQLKAKQTLACYGAREGELVIGIAPGAGASWGKDASLKHWPSKKYAQLADKMIDSFGAKVVILGDISERPIVDAVVDNMRHKPIDLVGKTTLEEFAAIIEQLKLLITNDGGPLHMAAGLKIKTVSIFGPVDEKVYGPYPQSDSHIVVKHDINCRPCYQNFKMPQCLKQRACIEEITVDEVFDAARRLVG